MFDLMMEKLSLSMALFWVCCALTLAKTPLPQAHAEDHLTECVPCLGMRTSPRPRYGLVTA